MPPPPPKLSLVSFKWIVVVVAVAVVAVCLLIPDDTALVGKLMRDGSYERASQVLSKIPAATKAARPAYYEKLDLEIGRRRLSKDNPDLAEKHTRRAVDAFLKFEGDEAFFQELQGSLSALSDSKTAFALIYPALSKLSSAQRTKIADYIVSLALSENNPEAAADYHRELIPRPNQAEVQEQVRLWRMAGKPKEAVYAIDDFVVDRRQTLVTIDQDLADLFVQLLRETGENERALDVIRERLPGAKSEVEASHLFDLLNTVALNAGKAADLKDDYEDWLEKHPNDMRALEAYIPILSAAGDLARTAEIYGILHRHDPDNREFRRNYAQYLEWSDQAELAFDIHLEEIRDGNLEALERATVLNPGLNRHEDLAAAYEHMPGTYTTETHLKELARLRVELGHYEQAEDLYRRLSELDPEEPSYLYERAQLQRSLFAFKEARLCLEKLLALNPDDRKGLEAYASLLNCTGDYAAALPYLKRLAEKEPASLAVESYLLLATSTGGLEHVVSALELKIGNLNAEAQDYIELADTYSVLGRQDKQLQTIDRGLAKRNGAAMQMYAVSLFMDKNMFSRARSVLAGLPNLRTNEELAVSYLQAAFEMKDFAEAERFLNGGLPAAMLKKLPILKLAAAVYETRKKLDKARPLFAEIYRKEGGFSSALDYARISFELGDTVTAKQVLAPYARSGLASVMELRAQIAMKEKRFREAEYLQKELVATGQGNKSENWNTLGDIFQEQGKKVSARSAYIRAIQARTAARGSQ